MRRSHETRLRKGYRKTQDTSEKNCYYANVLKVNKTKHDFIKTFKMTHYANVNKNKKS